MNVKLSLLNKYTIKDKFKIFYKFRFDKDYLKYNINKFKFKKNESKIWYTKNYKRKKLFAIYFNKKKVGLIIYNLDNFFYSIILLKSYRYKGIGKTALNLFINYLKKRGGKLKTIININNIHSINLHRNIYKNKKKFNKNFYYFDIL